MNFYSLKKQWMSLIEMMIVMFLIAMITAVIAYNYTGSLEEGKAFKTKVGIEKIHTILDLYLAVHPEDHDYLDTKWKNIVADSPLVKNPDEVTRDGWGVEYQVGKDQYGNLEIKSDKYIAYQNSKGKGSLFTKEK
jgi:general secretion pathway protein G